MYWGEPKRRLTQCRETFLKEFEHRAWLHPSHCSPPMDLPNFQYLLPLDFPKLRCFEVFEYFSSPDSKNPLLQLGIPQAVGPCGGACPSQPQVLATGAIFWGRRSPRSQGNHGNHRILGQNSQILTHIHVIYVIYVLISILIQLDINFDF